jgi:hypothetical protein
LVGPNRRDEYARQVLAWLEHVLPLYRQGNVNKRGYQWQADDDDPPAFNWFLDTRIYLCPPRPTDLLLQLQGDYKKARRRIYELAERLLIEARPKHRKALQQRMRDELL